MTGAKNSPWWLAVLASCLQLVAFSSVGAESAAPLVIGETFTLQSKALGETRRINVYLPPGYADSPDKRFPVLYMPDGGLAEDFLHVAGLVQVSVGNGSMHPFVLVGIENTERRRDLSGPTQNEEDLFDTYIAIDPSMWWNDQALVRTTAERLRALPKLDKALWFASSGEQRGDGIERFASAVQANAPQGLRWHYEAMPQEKHSTIYHPAALKAFRAVFRP